MWLPTRPRRGRDSNCARPFPLTNFRATCCVTAMRSLAMNFGNRCKAWASAKFCLHRAHLGSEPMSTGDWIRSPWVPRSCDRVPWKLVTTNPDVVFRLLSPIEDASFVGQGLTSATSDSTSGNGVRHGGAAGRWTDHRYERRAAWKRPNPPRCALPFALALCNLRLISAPLTRLHHANCVHQHQPGPPTVWPSWSGWGITFPVTRLGAEPRSWYFEPCIVTISGGGICPSPIVAERSIHHLN